MDRRAARVLLLADRSVLLIKGFDPARPEAGSWWLTPGGGIEDDEAIDVAAGREVREETGLELDAADLGDPVATRVAEFEFDGRDYRQTEWFFAVRVARFDPHGDGWEEIEQRSLLEHRWWDVDDLAATDETIYPIELATLVRAVLADVITTPMELSGS